ncbi:MAG: adenylyltransferase/cytidyltransferase family protein [Alphaproteobacteria bacterium]|jgi:riboflavin kinase/FMN adenylyltransferase|nr:adenylyltransferase/cytidyltransferase family protein [Alphaproteobacteria bacterium]MBP9877504.1 adenylyltransferase/cytidyltransferase family protein [Alphaproteobacteria bacterium]
MHTFQNIKETIPNLKGCVLTIGNFDGVHLGHQKMIRQVKDIAKEQNMPSAVMSFEPHPRDYFSHGQSNEKRLSTADEKRKLFDSMGLDYYFELTFNEDLASMSGTEFIEQILIEWAKANYIVVGDNFYFGKGKSGSVTLLREYEAKGFFTVQIPDYARDQNGEIISSTYIRDCLAAGDFEKAKSLLGHPIQN